MHLNTKPSESNKNYTMNVWVFFFFFLEGGFCFSCTSEGKGRLLSFFKLINLRTVFFLFLFLYPLLFLMLPLSKFRLDVGTVVLVIVREGVL